MKMNFTINKKKKSEDSLETGLNEERVSGFNSSISNEKKSFFSKEKRKKEPKEVRVLTPDEEAARIFKCIILGATSLSVVLGLLTLRDSYNYDPKEHTTIDTSSVSTYRSFVDSANLDKYVDMILKHNNETQNNELDIKKITSNIGREYPFTTILNKYNDNMTTKLTKFIYNELKPAIISYKLANNVLPTNDEIPSEDNYYTVDMSLLDSLLNIRDASLSGFTYQMKDSNVNSNIQIRVLDGESPVQVLIFDIEQFKIKSISETEVSLTYGNYNLVLGLKEEFNNVRVDNIKFVMNNDGTIDKYAIIVDTLTNKKVSILKK